ncbi:MAG: hypothetical protein EXR98_08930 [Gemmataceae bacterium]|nr:hypothetical protein [Gemmataceae bacterium]
MLHRLGQGEVVNAQGGLMHILWRDLFGVRQKDIGWFEIAVGDPLLMGNFKDVGRLGNHGDGDFPCQRLRRFAPSLRQRLHGQIDCRRSRKSCVCWKFGSTGAGVRQEFRKFMNRK